MATEKLESLISRLEAATQKLERLGTKGGSGGEDSEFIPPFEQIISGSVSKFVKLSESISAEVKESANLLHQGFQVSLEMLKVVAVSKKPSDSEMGSVLKPLSDKIAEIKGYADKNFKSEYKAHLEAVGAISVGLGWFPATMKPQNSVKEAIDSGMFYTNRVLTSFKDKGPQHKEWVQALVQCFKDLQQYLEDYHATGCCWNISGKAAAAPSSGLAPSAPKVPTQSPAAKTSSGPPSTVNLLADLNKGTNITSGLKKVDDSMKTHKNPSLRAGCTVADKAPTGGAASSKTPAKAVEKPPVFELQGKKWMIGEQRGQEMLVIDQGDMGFTGQVWCCKKSNMKFTTKMNTISIENCHDCKFQFSAGLIGSCEIINSEKIDIHVDEVIPFITINSSDNCQIYLNQKSIQSKVSTAKSAGINVCVWDSNNELKEYPVPGQFVSSMENGKLVTQESENI